MSDHVLVAGGGIGGLTAAIALRRAGFGVRLFERAPEIREVGAGINIQSNAVLALRHISLGDAGLDEAVIAGGRLMGWASLRTTDDRVISREDMAAVGRAVGAPGVAIHRATLQHLLVDALGPGVLETGREVTGYTARPDGVTVRFRDGGTADGALLVGADGIRSAVRAQLLGDGEPLYSGYVAWRGVTPAGGAVPEETVETWGPGRRFGIVPIDHGRVYWYATLNTPPGGHDDPGRHRETLLRLFAGWHAPIPALLEATPEEAILRNDIVHRLPVEKWGEGRVTLLGDAAHPMTPNLGQGACQAIEDAVVLAHCLRENTGAPTAALRHYEARRIPRANGFVLASMRLGRLGQWENRAACWLRDRALGLVPAAAARRQLVRSMRFELWESASAAG
ncbi:MAG TPA: FAD-dependent monooxygenase [Thermoanaerobaculia bacterium]|nr:FAD-dependent monooxygenase [Thermoanaerobaculia bacterium]